MVPGDVEGTVGGWSRWRDLAVMRLAVVKGGEQTVIFTVHGFLGDDGVLTLCTRYMLDDVIIQE
jgi:hypothetical protein